MEMLENNYNSCAGWTAPDFFARTLALWTLTRNVFSPMISL